MSAKKPQPRAISLDYPFRDPRVVNVRFSDPQTLLDRDVVIWDPDGFYRQYRTGLTSFQGAYTVGDDDSPRLRRDVARRRRELKQLLELGKAVVLFVPAPDHCVAGTGTFEYSGTGRNRRSIRHVDEVSVLEPLPFRLDVEVGASTELELRVGEPFASFWRANRDRLASAGVMPKPPGETVLVIKGTNAAVASIAHFAKGVVLLLPGQLLYEEEEDEPGEDSDEPYPDPEDEAFLDSLFELIAAVRRKAGDFELPAWTSAYLLPREREGQEQINKAEQRLAKMLSGIDKQKQQLEALRQRKLLFAGTGPALENAVESALQAFGFNVEEGRPGRTDRVLRYGDDVAVVEVKGLAKSAGEKDAAQLEKWASEYHVEHGVQPKGILIVNGWRDKPLHKRTQEAFPEQMLKFSVGRGHALVTGTQLLAAWLDVEANPEKADEVADSLLKCVGRYERYGDGSSALMTVPPSIEEESDS